MGVAIGASFPTRATPNSGSVAAPERRALTRVGALCCHTGKHASRSTPTQLRWRGAGIQHRSHAAGRPGGFGFWCNGNVPEGSPDGCEDTEDLVRGRLHYKLGHGFKHHVLHASLMPD